MDKLDAEFNMMSGLLQEDRKDAIHVTVTSLKKAMAKHWKQMAEVDIDAFLKSIRDPTYVYLRQYLMPEGVDVSELTTKTPHVWDSYASCQSININKKFGSSLQQSLIIYLKLMCICVHTL